MLATAPTSLAGASSLRGPAGIRVALRAHGKIPAMNPSDLDTRAKALVDDKLIRAYWDAVEHYKTRDLVLIYAVGDATYPVRAFVREELLASSFPADLKAKVANPASDSSSRPAGSDATFWLLAIFSEEEAVCLPVNATLLAPGGRA